MISQAYWLFDTDILNRSLIDWVSSHASFMPPLHRYEGRITLLNNCLFFEGVDKYNSIAVQFEIQKIEFEQLYLGFDEVFTTFEARGLGFWKPLKIDFYQHKKISSVYLITNYRMGFTDNKLWFEQLKEWLE